MKRTLALELISFLYVLLFVYAAVSKLFEYEKFTIQVGQSPLLTGFGDVIPLLVISLELGIAVLFAFEKTRIVALFAGFSLMLMFSAYIVAILKFSPYVPCSCGGILESMTWRTHLIFNLAFVGLGLAGILLQYSLSRSVSLSADKL